MEKSEGLEAVQNTKGGIAISEIPNSIKKQAMDREFQPSVRIGKTGITANIVDEIRTQLAKRKLVKIKINKGFTTVKIAQKCGNILHKKHLLWWY